MTPPGKGGTIKRIIERLNARNCRVVALGTPTERERSQWYFQRYVPHLPAGGEIVLFDRSWYNRAGVERVMGFCTDEEHTEFFRTCPQLERALVRSGIILVKYWLSLSDEEQERRFTERINNPGKRWKLSPMDLEARARWVDYAEAKDEMFSYTDIREAPWHVVDANDKKAARLNIISHLLEIGAPRRRAARGGRAPAPPAALVLASADRQSDLGAAALRRALTARRLQAGELAVELGEAHGAEVERGAVELLEVERRAAACSRRVAGAEPHPLADLVARSPGPGSPR